MIAKVLLIFCALMVLLFVFRCFMGAHCLKKNFRRCNCIVSGKKGTGKDLIFQKVINLRKEEYYSNIDYGGKKKGFKPYSYNFCKALDLNLSPNQYYNFINGSVKVIDKSTVPYEGKDFYFSDGGIILPSQYDNMLYKMYPSFPIAYALSRHLWHNNIHINTQNLERVWKALREQADYYIITKGVLKLPFFLVVKFNTYDKYESAKQQLSPLSARLWNGYSKAEKDLYVATNGEVKSHIIIIRKKKIKYDTRAYHEQVFGIKFSEWLKREKESKKEKKRKEKEKEN